MMPNQRPSAQARGYNNRWNKARKSYLLSHPYCVMCAKQGKRTPATVVDHTTPHRGDQQLFWDKNNWSALCTPHHSSTKQRDEKRGYSSEIGIDGWPTSNDHPANMGRGVEKSKTLPV